jgi:hypothetical protein
MKIEAGKTHYLHLPEDHPIKRLCKEEKFDMRLQDKIMRTMEETVDLFLNSLIADREDVFHQAVEEFQEGLLVGPAPEQEDYEPVIVGPDGESPL